MSCGVCGAKNPFCMSCADCATEKARRTMAIKKSHCTGCCKYCNYCNNWGHNEANCRAKVYCDICQKTGHAKYREDGSIWCRNLMRCEICGRQGHLEPECRARWCSICRYDQTTDKFVGHTTAQCFKNKHN